MNIWSISQYASPAKYAYGTAHHYLSKEHVKNGHHVTIFSSAYNHYMYNGSVHNKWKFREEIDGVEYYWLKCVVYKNSHGLGRIFNWALFVLAFFIIGKKHIKKPDIVILSSHSLIPVFCALWCKYRYKSKIVTEIRDIWPRTLIEVSGKSKFHPLIMIISICEKLALRFSDWIVSTLPNYSEHVTEVLGHDNFNFTCIPQGAPLEVFESGKKLDPIYVETYLAKKTFKVVYAGAIGPSNSLETLIKVAKRLKANANIEFILLGDGKEKSRFQAECDGYDNISFAPRIKREYVQDFLSHCDLAYDSVKDIGLYRYGLSRQKWIDYMYAGLPIIVSYSGYKSLINEANCGIFLPSEDEQSLEEKIVEFSTMQEKELKEMGERGKYFIINNRIFSILSQKYEEIFSKLVC